MSSPRSALTLLGLECEFEEKILRLMTPFDGEMFNTYVSNIRRLLDNRYELRLPSRHTKKPWEWGASSGDLLSEIKNHRGYTELMSPFARTRASKSINE